MAEVADEIADAAEGIQDSEFFDEILNVIIEVQEEVEKVTSVTCSGGSMNGEACASGAVGQERCHLGHDGHVLE